MNDVRLHRDLQNLKSTNSLICFLKEIPKGGEKAFSIPLAHLRLFLALCSASGRGNVYLNAYFVKRFCVSVMVLAA